MDWSANERKLLRNLEFNPERYTREKLHFLVSHFKEDGSAAKVQDHPYFVAGVTARKIRDATRKGSLDWILNDLGPTDLAEDPAPIVVSIYFRMKI